MTPKTKNSLLKALAANPKASVRQRLKALHSMEPSVRFLTRLLRDPLLPGKVRVTVLKLLAEKTEPTSRKPRSKSEKEHDKCPLDSRAVQTDNVVRPAFTQDSETGLIFVDPKLYDLVGGFSDPRYVRGPEAPSDEPKPETTESKPMPHSWRTNAR